MILYAGIRSFHVHTCLPAWTRPVAPEPSCGSTKYIRHASFVYTIYIIFMYNNLLLGPGADEAATEFRITLYLGSVTELKQFLSYLINAGRERANRSRTNSRPGRTKRKGRECRERSHVPASMRHRDGLGSSCRDENFPCLISPTQRHSIAARRVRRRGGMGDGATKERFVGGLLRPPPERTASTWTSLSQSICRMKTARPREMLPFPSRGTNSSA